MPALARLAATALACLTAVPALADWDRDKLDKAIEGIEQASGGRLGVHAF